MMGRSQPSKRSLLIALSVLFGLVIAVTIGYMFRTSRQDHAELGIISNEYRWGKLKTVQIDVNRDGRPDGEFRLPAAGEFSDWHGRYVEGWESSRCDGTMDIHWRYTISGELVLEQDKDRDGVFDFRVLGPDAEKLLSRPPGLVECKARPGTSP